MANWIIDRTINLDEYKTREVLSELSIKPRKSDDELEKILHAKGVLKNAGDGALRRRWYTYLRNYGFLEGDEVTEIGSLYATKQLSLHEVALLQLSKKKIQLQNKNYITPLKILIKVLHSLYAISRDDAYLSREEFTNYVINIPNESDLEITKVFTKICESRKNGTSLSNIEGQHDDIWFNSLSQTKLFDYVGRSLFVTDFSMLEKLNDFYSANNESVFFGKFMSGLVNDIPSLVKRGTKFNISNSYLNEENEAHFLNDVLFSGDSTIKIEEKYFKNKKNYTGTFELLSLLNLDDKNIGIYSKYKNYKNLVLVYLTMCGDDEAKKIATLIKKFIDTNISSNDNISQNEETEVLELIKQMYSDGDFEYKSIVALCNNFKSLYGKDELIKLSGKDLLYRLFAPKDFNKDSLIYNIEFNNDLNYFGGIGGGSAYKFTLYYSKKNESWVSGTHKSNARKVTEEEAIELATKVRDGFVKVCQIIEDLIAKNGSNIIEYKNEEFLQSKLSEDDFDLIFQTAKDNLPNLYENGWVLKYFNILYPSLYSCFTNYWWFDRISKILNREFDGNFYKKNYKFTSLAIELEIPNIYLYRILLKLSSCYQEEPNEKDEKLEEVGDVEVKNIDRTPRTIKIHALNNILYGAPGTGKTYATAEYALAFLNDETLSSVRSKYTDRKSLMEDYQAKVNDGQIVFTTFHQSYGYEDFIQGLRPDSNAETMKFDVIDGVFKKIADKALVDKQNNYVIIIDEINRANISKVFGELITLIEEDKRWGEVNQLCVTLPSGDEFRIPNNLYILGTMNSADKSISLIDAALRRRFAFIEVAPNPELIEDVTLREIFEKLNTKIYNELDTSDLLIGHGYFIGKTIDDLCTILNQAIIPLLYEYYYDKANKVKDTLAKALESVKNDYVIVDSKMSRIKVVKKDND